jgi:hypothetical protein
MCFSRGCPISMKGRRTRARWCWASMAASLTSLLGSLPMLSLRDCRSFDLGHIPHRLRNPLTSVLSVSLRQSIAKRETLKPWTEREENVNCNKKLGTYNATLWQNIFSNPSVPLSMRNIFYRVCGPEFSSHQPFFIQFAFHFISSFTERRGRGPLAPFCKHPSQCQEMRLRLVYAAPQHIVPSIF